MPACAKFVKALRVLLLFTGILLTGGCEQQTSGQRFDIQQVELRWTNGQLNVSLQQSLLLSNEAQKALDNGVPLTFEVELVLRNTANQTRVNESLERYQIRYLPLSRRFQLTLPGGEEIKTFPRLRHLLADLGNLRISIRTGALPEGNYELMARSRIDKRKMPLSMRLPTMFDSEWKHDSNWSSWPLEIGPQA